MITLPEQPLKEGRRYPVLYYLDAWESAEMFNLMGPALYAYQESAPVILVGISFEADDESFLQLRNEDFLPNLSQPESLHSAKLFLTFIRSELIPYIESHYPVDTGTRGLFGYSNGGLFAAWVIKEDPELFNRIGMGSPTLGKYGQALLNDPEYIARIRHLKGAKIFTSCGSNESEEMIAGVKTMAAYLASNADIQSANFIFENDGHGSAYMPTCIKALSYLFAIEK
jgi:hypothetical protein